MTERRREEQFRYFDFSAHSSKNEQRILFEKIKDNEENVTWNAIMNIHRAGNLFFSWQQFLLLICEESKEYNRTQR